MRPASAPRRPAARRLAAAIVLACAAAAAAPAIGRSIDIEDFSVDIVVDESGGLAVAETLRLRFTGLWNGIIRNIPIQNVTSRGERRNLGFRLESVADDAGNRLEVTRTRRGADMDLKIRVPGAADAVRTVVIRYRIAGGLRFFDDHDELYWNVTGDEWSFPIHAARARITLPASVVNVRANGFTGGHGSREREVTIGVDGMVRQPDDTFAPAGESPRAAGGGHVVEIEAKRPLGIHEGLTAVVGWNAGVIRRPSAWARLVLAWTSWFAGRSALLVAWAAPVLAFAAMFRRWWKFGRDPRPGPLVVQYAPPAGLGPAEVGTLVDNTPDTRDIMAGLVDAAVKGVVRIRETKPKGWLSSARYSFDLLVPERRWEAAGIPPSGVKLLRGIFRTRSDGDPGADGVVATRASTDLAESFYRHLPRIKDAIFGDLVNRGFYRVRPDTTVVGYLFAAVASGVLVFVLGLFVFTWTGFQDDATRIFTSLGLGLATLLTVGGFGVFMPARTKAGAAARDQIRGFQEFLSRVDAHRLESLPLEPALFEKYLPYAMALGVQRRWAQAFADICREPPTWYVGTSPDVVFDTGDFIDHLGVMGASTAAVMKSSPRSSGTSGFGGDGGSFLGGGFSGGGFSGGGDGGGGGSGW